MKCWWVGRVKSWDELSSLLASSLLSELAAHRWATAGCRGEQSARFMRRSLTHPQLYCLQNALFTPQHVCSKSSPGVRGNAKNLLCISVQVCHMCRDKRKEASHCAWSTERYYVIGKWIALCMPGQCHWGSAAQHRGPGHYNVSLPPAQHLSDVNFIIDII